MSYGYRVQNPRGTAAAGTNRDKQLRFGQCSTSDVIIVMCDHHFRRGAIWQPLLGTSTLVPLT